MKNMEINNENGFAPAQELLLIAVVVGLVILGTFAYKSRHPVSVTKTNPAPTASATPSTFAVPELKVTMTLPAGLTGVTYAPFTSSDGGLLGYGVTDATLQNIDPSCSADKASLGVLSVKASDWTAGGGSTVDKKDLGNGKVLVLDEPNGPCFSSPAIVGDQAIFNKDSAVQVRQTALLKQAIESAKYSE